VTASSSDFLTIGASTLASNTESNPAKAIFILKFCSASLRIASVNFSLSPCVSVAHIGVSTKVSITAPLNNFLPATPNHLVTAFLRVSVACGPALDKAVSVSDLSAGMFLAK